MRASILYIFKADREIIPATSSRMFCTYCGARLVANAAACSACGEPTSVTASTMLGTDATRLGADATRLGTSPDGTHLGTSPDAMTSLGTGSAHAHQFGTRGSAVATQTPPGVPVMPGSPLAPGTAFGSRYHIIRLLGMGGMGAVYQAWDDELGVAVALKVIRPEITADPASARDLERRFKRELLLARQVTHKNVVRIHDLGEIDGIKYITMPYIQGRDLGSVLSKQGKLPVSRAVAIAKQVVSGLVAAHDAGVVHRDLKPANIMIDEDDQAVIMDFGIARSVSGGGATVAGAVVGTLEYMAPEQAMARPVDQRADVYAFGLILYDMVLGPRQAMRAESAVAELMARVQNPLPPARGVDPSIPEPLERIIDKCSQPDPAARYQTSAQLAHDLDLLDNAGRQPAGTGGFSAPPITRQHTQPIELPKSRGVPLKAVLAAVAVLVLAAGGWLLRDLFGTRSASGGSASATVDRPVAFAVVPFLNTTGDASLDSLGQVLAELIRTDIGQSSRLRPVSSDRVFSLLRDLRLPANQEIDTRNVEKIAEFASADSVVTGRFSKSADQIRIDASLHAAKGGEPVIVSASAAGENDLMRAAHEIAAQILTKLTPAGSSSGDVRTDAFKPSTQSVQALKYDGEGQQFSRVGEHLEAVKRFDAATKADPKFALAYAQLGQALATLRRTSDAEAAAKQAVALSASLPPEEREMISGAAARITNDLDTAIASYERLVNARPMDVQLRFELAGLLDSNGALDRARDEYAKVLEADPKFPDALFAAGRNAIRRRDYKGSLEWLAPAQILAEQLDNKEAQARTLHALGVAYKNLGRLDDARKKYEDSLEIKRKIGDSGGIAQSLNELAQVHDLQGRSDAAVASYKEAIEAYKVIGNKRGVGLALNNLGAYYRDRGRYDEALSTFKEALPIQRELGDEDRQALCLYNIGSTYSAKGEYLEASTYLERALELRERLKVAGSTAEVLSTLGEVSTLLGEFDRAQRHFLRAIELSRGAADRRSEAVGSMGMGTLHILQGRYGAALGAKGEALKSVRELNERSYDLVQALSGHGAALSLAGRFEEAAKELDEALTVARELKNETLLARTLDLQGDNAYYRGDDRTARGLYEQARQAAQRSSSRYEVLRSNLNLARLGGAAQAGTLKNLMREADDLGLKYLSAESSLYLGAALIAAKNAAQARSELDNAVAKSDKLGARMLLIQSHNSLGEALRSTDANAAADHSAKAQQILQEVRAELKNDAILSRRDLKSIQQTRGGTD